MRLTLRVDTPPPPPTVSQIVKNTFLYTFPTLRVLAVNPPCPESQTKNIVSHIPVFYCLMVIGDTEEIRKKSAEMDNQPVIFKLLSTYYYHYGVETCARHLFRFSPSECWKSVLTNLNLFVTDENGNYLFPIIRILYCHRVGPCAWLTPQE